MAFLIFQLKAPLASFGDSLGDFKGTAQRPRKSAVLGLVAAAIGIERHENDRFRELFSTLKFAVAVLKAPSALHDFQTVQAPERAFAYTRRDQLASGEPNTVLAARDYLQDGHWLVALEGMPAHLLAVKSALEAPRFPLYLGRKACPLSAFTAPQLVEDADCVGAAMQRWLQETPAPVQLPRQSVEVAWEASTTCRIRPTLSRRVNDVRTSLSAHFMTARQEMEGTLEMKGVVPCI